MTSEKINKIIKLTKKISAADENTLKDLSCATSLETLQIPSFSKKDSLLHELNSAITFGEVNKRLMTTDYSDHLNSGQHVYDAFKQRLGKVLSPEEVEEYLTLVGIPNLAAYQAIYEDAVATVVPGHKALFLRNASAHYAWLPFIAFIGLCINFLLNAIYFDTIIQVNSAFAFRPFQNITPANITGLPASQHRALLEVIESEGPFYPLTQPRELAQWEPIEQYYFAQLNVLQGFGLPLSRFGEHIIAYIAGSVELRDMYEDDFFWVKAVGGFNSLRFLFAIFALLTLVNLPAYMQTVRMDHPARMFTLFLMGTFFLMDYCAHTAATIVHATNLFWAHTDQTAGDICREIYSKKLPLHQSIPCGDIGPSVRVTLPPAYIEALTPMLPTPILSPEFDQDLSITALFGMLFKLCVVLLLSEPFLNALYTRIKPLVTETAPTADASPFVLYQERQKELAEALEDAAAAETDMSTSVM